MDERRPDPQELFDDLAADYLHLPGRQMKEWVMIDPPATPADDAVWRQLMADASSYAGSVTSR